MHLASWLPPVLPLRGGRESPYRRDYTMKGILMCCGLQVVWPTICSFLLELWARRDEKIRYYAVDMGCIGFRSSPESVLIWLLHIGLHYLIICPKCQEFCARISNALKMAYWCKPPTLNSQYTFRETAIAQHSLDIPSPSFRVLHMLAIFAVQSPPSSQQPQIASMAHRSQTAIVPSP